MTTAEIARRCQGLPAYQPVSQDDALVHAEAMGVDGIYGAGADWHQALKDTAAQWEAEGIKARAAAALAAADPEPAAVPHPHARPLTRKDHHPR